MQLQDWVEKYYKDEHYNCSEALIRAANSFYQLGLDEFGMKMLSGFGSGMYTGLTCGALVASVAILSKFMIQTKAHDQLSDFRPVIQSCVRHFKTILGDTECKNIRPHSYSPELHCFHTVQASACALEQVIQEYKLAK